MKIKSISKLMLSLLMISIPFNFIVIESIGNLYFSTILIFFEFLFFLTISKGGLIRKPNILLALFFLFFFLFSTVISMLIGDGVFRTQMVFTVIHVQIIFVFILTYYFLERVSIDFVLKLFLLIVFLASLRLIIEEYDKLFTFSTVRGQRLQGNFIGAINNFALILGIALLISFFYIKNKTLKIFLTIYLLLFITLTLSRGALLGIVVTFFAVAAYDRDRRTLKALIRLSLLIVVISFVAILYFDKIDIVIDQFEARFLSVFTGDSNVSKFSAGRWIIWEDILKNHFLKSSFFEYLFGHGVGGIDFIKGNTGFRYESSHNIIIDILYRNGILFLLAYLLIVIKIILLFMNRRLKSKLFLFGVFVFLHLELLVNPFAYTVQTGWIYTLFLAIFIKQNNLLFLNSEIHEDSINV